MHTYLKMTDGCYAVGMWLPNAEGRTAFAPLFDVPTRNEALTAVNRLNGGSIEKFFRVTREHD